MLVGSHARKIPDITEVIAPTVHTVEIDIRRVVGFVDRTGEAEVFVCRECVKDRLGAIEFTADELRVLATSATASTEVDGPVLVDGGSIER